MPARSSSHNSPDIRFYALALAAIAATASILYAMGRDPICACGTVKFWHGLAVSPENSQHIADWYTFSHITHGFIFCGLYRFFAPGWPASRRLLGAVLMAGAWEIFENIDAVISRFRDQTIALDYFGDSILNSVSDIVAMALGFLAAARLDWRMTLALGLAMEVTAGAIIRDNLSLTAVMLLYPFDFIKEWQMAR